MVMAKSLIYSLPRPISASAEDEPPRPVPSRPGGYIGDMIQTSGDDVHTLDRHQNPATVLKNSRVF